MFGVGDRVPHSELVLAQFWTETHLTALDRCLFLCFQSNKGRGHYEDG